jgi:hypothetical protein
MLNSIIKAAQDQLGGVIQEKTGLSTADGQKALSFLEGSLVSSVKDQVASGNLSGLTSLFGGKAPVAGNPIVEGLVKNYAGTLISKMGLSQNIASTLSSVVVPFVTEKVVSSFASKGGVSAADVTALLGGGGGGLGSIAKGLGGLFGK